MDKNRKNLASASFGEFLKSLRTKSETFSQRKTAEELSKLGYRVSQALVAQYETGRIHDPDITVLYGMSKLYNYSFDRILLRLAKSKRDSVLDPTEPVQALWNVIDCAADPPTSDIDKMPAAEVFQYEAKADFLRLPALSVQGILHWSQSFNDLKTVLVIVPNFVDDQNDVVFNNTVDIIKKRKAKYIYFVSERDILDGGRFMILKHKLIAALGTDIYKEYVEAVTLSKAELTWLRSDHVVYLDSKNDIASAAGFQFIRSEGRPFIGVYMEKSELHKLLEGLQSWGAATQKRSLTKVLPFKTNQAKG